MFRDAYSNNGFFDAFAADVTGSAQGDENGNTIDLRGYDTATIVMNAQSFASAGAMAAADVVYFKLQHGLASAAGVSAWSLVPNSMIIHSVYGGTDSTGETGTFASLASTTDVTAVSGIFKVGYKGDVDHRYLRVIVRNSDNASAMWAAGVAILGQPANWPVNEPV